jgi:signal transduction histidine kinase
MRQDRELAEKRAGDDQRRTAAAAGQELSARLGTVLLRAVAGNATPADREIALVGTVDSGAVRFPWDRLTDAVRPVDAQEMQAARLMHTQSGLAVGLLREARRNASSGSARARATLLLAAALERGGHIREAAGSLRELSVLPAGVVDEYGIPYFLYGAVRIAHGSGSIDANLLRDLQAVFQSTWLPPSAMFMIADTARQAGPAGVTLLNRTLAKAGETERAVGMLTESAARNFPDLRISIEGDQPLMAFMHDANGGGRTLVAVRTHPVLESIKLPSGARWVIGSAVSGVTVNDSAPQLKIQFPPAGSEDPWGQRRVLYGGALGLMLLTTALTTFMLYRDVQREAGLARLRSAFVSSVSHELRTPVATIRAYAEMLDMQRIGPGDRPAYLKTIISESERLSRLVEGVLEFSRLEQGKRTYRLEPMCLSEVVESATHAIRCALEQNGFHLRFAAEPDVCVRADRYAMEQVFINLLNNAIKYSGRERAIDVSMSRHEREAVVEIRDYGIGIPVEQQKRIFERFYRAEAPGGRNTPGVGLGLSIVEQVVAAHGGRVTVRSTPGEGSAFSVFLPLHV